MKTTSTQMPTLPTIPAKSDAEFQAGKRLYAEQWGDAVVTNTYLKITILALCLLCAGSLYIAYTTVKKIDSSANVVTVNTTSSQTIDGASTARLEKAYDAVAVVSDGANWMIV